MSALIIENLTREAFAPFGDVIDCQQDQRHFTINEGNTERFHDMAKVDVADQGGRTLINVFRAQPRDYPLAIEMMERHPLGSQAFIPLAKQAFLVVVAAAGDPPGPGDLRAFLAQPGQGVNYAKGVWHHPVLALGEETDFLVVDRGGPGDNCDVVELSGEPRSLSPPGD